MGIVFAVDLPTGKLVWRTSKLSVFHGQAMMLIQNGFSISQAGIVTDGQRVLATVGAVTAATCRTGTATGCSAWTPRRAK